MEYVRLERVESTVFRWIKEYILNKGKVSPEHVVVHRLPPTAEIHFLDSFSKSTTWLRANTAGIWSCELCAPALVSSARAYNLIVRFNREEDALAFKLTWN